MKVSFSVCNLKLPDFSRSYKVIASCHHRGTVNSGHWFTKILTANNVWYCLDDLMPKAIPTCPPGSDDDSVTVLLLAAEDKFQSLSSVFSLCSSFCSFSGISFNCISDYALCVILFCSIWWIGSCFICCMVEWGSPCVGFPTIAPGC